MALFLLVVGVANLYFGYSLMTYKKWCYYGSIPILGYGLVWFISYHNIGGALCMLLLLWYILNPTSKKILFRHNNKMPKEAKPVRKGLYSKWWLLWWKITPEALNRQVENYATLKVTQSARGVSFLLCILSAILGFFGGFATDTKTTVYTIFGSVISAILSLVFGFLVYIGRRWAIIIVMTYWTIEKLYMGYTQVITGNATFIWQIIFWTLYMHAFYVALTVENLRRKIKVNVA